jgi:hypothetical protein
MRNTKLDGEHIAWSRFVQQGVVHGAHGFRKIGVLGNVGRCHHQLEADVLAAVLAIGKDGAAGEQG